MRPKSTAKLTAAMAPLTLALWATSANATVFELYNDLGPYLGNGSELAEALVTPGSGINVINGSELFQGNFDGTPVFPPDEFPGDGPFPDFPPDPDFPLPPDPDTSFGPDDYGSASFFSGLNFGSADGTDFVLPDGILLTSGFAAPPTENTSPDFEGIASGFGDEGLDALLDAAGFPFETTTDATVLSFDFTVDADINAISLDFIFGSEEFPEFADEFPEIAAVFVDGVNYASFADGRLLSVTSEAIAAGNFFDNTPSLLDIEYDGISAPMNLLGLLDMEQDVHNIKIAISDTGDTALDSGLFAANLQGTFVGGFDALDPLMPIEGDDPSDGFDFIIDVGDAGVGIDPTMPIFIDPYVATGYTYESTGANFATVVLPSGFGDDSYNVYGWDGSGWLFLGTVDAGVTFDFLAHNASGFGQFMIDGIETEAMVDPTDPGAFVTGVTFTNGGQIAVVQTPIETFVSVPEPETMLLFATGLIGLSAVARRQKKASN